MNGVRKVERLDPDGQLFVSLTEEVDLDDLLLHLLMEGHGEVYSELGIDFPTALFDKEWQSPQVDVGRYRNVPCHCGDEHAYDVRTVSEGANQRGSYLGVMTR